MTVTIILATATAAVKRVVLKEVMSWATVVRAAATSADAAVAAAEAPSSGSSGSEYVPTAAVHQPFAVGLPVQSCPAACSATTCAGADGGRGRDRGRGQKEEEEKEEEEEEEEEGAVNVINTDDDSEL